MDNCFARCSDESFLADRDRFLTVIKRMKLMNAYGTPSVSYKMDTMNKQNDRHTFWNWSGSRPASWGPDWLNYAWDSTGPVHTGRIYGLACIYGQFVPGFNKMRYQKKHSPTDRPTYRDHQPWSSLVVLLAFVLHYRGRL